MNANEMTDIRELTADEANVVAGGEKYERGTYHFSFMGLVFSGDNTYGCIWYPTEDGGWGGMCY